MAAPRIRFTPDPLQEEKKKVEVLIEHLKDKILNNPVEQKKAALLIEEWLKEKPKPCKR